MSPSHNFEFKTNSAIFNSIIAVHGLGSKPETAWSYAADKNLWLRDFLPEEGLNARILAYYHSSHWRSNALLIDVKELGRDLVQTIERSREHLDVGLSFTQS